MTATWIHKDPRTARVAAEAGLRRAYALDWKTGPLALREADFRGYLLAHAYAEAVFAGSVGETEGDYRLTLPSVAGLPNNERARVLRALRRTTDELAAQDASFALWTPPVAIVTEGKELPETAGLPAIAVVAVALGAAAAVGYLAHQAAQVVDNYLARKHVLAQVVQADAQVTQLVTAHAERERSSGKSLPLDAATKRALDGLEGRQRELSKQTTPPISGGLPSSPFAAFSAGAAVAAGLLFVGAVWLLK